MSPDEIERLLTAEELIEPSPSFAAAVMAAVREEAAAPAPIAFPWRRALPGLLLATAGLVAMIVLLAGAFLSAPAAPEVAGSWRAPAWLPAGHLWTVLALAGSLLLAWLVTRLAQSGADPAL